MPAETADTLRFWSSSERGPGIAVARIRRCSMGAVVIAAPWGSLVCQPGGDAPARPMFRQPYHVVQYLRSPLRGRSGSYVEAGGGWAHGLSLIHISEPTRQAEISYAVFCL